MRCKGRASRTFTVGVGLQGQAQGDWPPTSNGGCRQVGVGACGTGCIPGLPPKTLEFRQPGVPLCSGDSAISLDGVLPVAHPPLPRWSASPTPPSPPPSPLSLRVALSPPAPHLCPRTPCGWAAVVPRADAFGCVRLDSSDVARAGWLLFSACCLSQRMHVTSTHSLAPSSDLALRKITRMREVFAESCMCICTY